MAKLFNVTDGRVDWWVISDCLENAKQGISEHLGDCEEGDYVDPEYQLGGCEVGPSQELTFHCSRKPIKHTAEDWLIIYDGFDTQPFVACSEF